jgi:mRNA interferase RelE/StbE
MPDKITKFIEALNKKTRRQLKEKLLALKQSPFNIKGVKKMQGWGENTYRLRMGKIRVIYRIMNKDIEIVDIDYRGNIY